MENWDSVWREIQEHERKNEISASDKLYQYLNNRVNYIKGPLKYEVCLTSQCNQHCLHCSNGLINKTSIFNCESMKPILDQEPVMIVLTGGEPLLHPQINSLISMIKKQGAFLKLCTNGIGLTEVVCNDLADRFEKYDIIQISFDAADKETYARIRGSAYFDKLLENIQTVRRKLPEVTIELHCVPNRYNLRQMLQIYTLVKALGANIFSTAPLAYLGRAKREYQADILSLLQLERDLYRYSDNHTRYIGRLFEICSLYGVLQPPYSQVLAKDNVYRCDAGLSTIYIDCDEEVYPCVYLKEPTFRLGYLKEGLPILIARARARYIHGIAIKDSACGTCDLWGLCHGGCIGVSYAYAGKAKPGLDPRCGQFNKDRKLCLEKEGT